MKPIFSANNRWAMAKGEESLKLELARRHAAQRCSGKVCLSRWTIRIHKLLSCQVVIVPRSLEVTHLQARFWVCSELPTDPETMLGHRAARRDSTILLAIGSTGCCSGATAACQHYRALVVRWKTGLDLLQGEASTCTRNVELLETALACGNKVYSGSLSVYAFLQRAREASLKHTDLTEERVGLQEGSQQVSES